MSNKNRSIPKIIIKIPKPIMGWVVRNRNIMLINFSINKIIPPAIK